MKTRNIAIILLVIFVTLVLVNLIKFEKTGNYIGPIPKTLKEGTVYGVILFLHSLFCLSWFSC